MVEETKLFVLKLLKLFLFLFLIGCSNSHLELLIEHPSQSRELLLNKKNSVNTAKLFFYNKKDFIPLELIIDTGSPFTMVTEPIDFKTSGTKNMQFHSVNRSYQKEFRIIYADILDDQKRLISINQEVSATNLPKEILYDGILGNDILSKQNLFLEVPDKISFIKILNEKKIEKEFQKIPFIFNGEHIFVKMNSKQLQGYFILDTGAGVSCLNNEKFLNGNYIEYGKIKFHSFDPDEEETKLYLFDNLCIEKSYCKKNIEFISMDLKELSNKKDKIILLGVLGQNWMKHYSILLNFEKQVLYIKER